MENFNMLTEKEMMEIDGGSWAGVWAGVKAAGAVVGCGAAGVVVGAGVLVGTYYALTWLLG